MMLYAFTTVFSRRSIKLLAHLLRRCRDMMKTLHGSARRFPGDVQTLLQKAADLRDRYRLGEISQRGLAVAAGRIESRLDRLLHRRFAPDNRRFANHLSHEQPWIFSFLHCPGLDATNNVAERAIRPAVVARHTWGGNRTANGATNQQVLMSVVRSYWQSKKIPSPVLFNCFVHVIPKSSTSSQLPFPHNLEPALHFALSCPPLVYTSAHPCPRRRVKQ